MHGWGGQGAVFFGVCVLLSMRGWGGQGAVWFEVYAWLGWPGGVLKSA